MNPFKQMLEQKRALMLPSFGCWLASGSEINAEVLAGAGFDWLCVDMEHGAQDTPQLRGLYAAIAAGSRPLDGSASTLPAVMTRVPWNDMVTLKRVLDAGVDSVLVPMLQTAEEAQLAVSYTRYPPAGVRGVAGGSAASRYGRITDYLHTASERVCVIGQIESQQGLDNCEAIAAVPGLDALFVGPADLSASLGLLGQPSHPVVLQAIDRVVAAAKAHGKPCGVFSFNPADAAMFSARGVAFIALGSDLGALGMGAKALLNAATSAK